MTPYETTRWRCDHCRKSYARKGACASHEAECHLDPDVRACTTCVHFQPPTNRWEANGCGLDAFPVWDDPVTGREERVCFVRHCSEWETA